MTGNDMLAHAGITQPVNEWALDYGIYPAVILDRLARGWSAARAITTPMLAAPHQRLDHRHMPGVSATSRKRPGAGPAPVVYQHGGLSLTVQEWSRATGLKAPTIRRRLRKGWPVRWAVSTAVCRPGVPVDFSEPVGTGGGPIAQDFTEIEFSQ